MDHRWKVLLVSAAGAFLAFLDATIVNVAFPDMRRSFPDASLSGLSWVLNAYNIVFAALLVPAGRVADLLGRRRVFVGGLLLFALASVLCALAPSAELLVAARVLQAAGGAALVPTSIAFLLSEFPIEQRAMAVGLWGAAAAVAATVGPTVGGLLIEIENWRLVFAVNLPVALAAAWGAGRLIEERRPAGAPLPDALGVALIVVAVGALSLGIVQGPVWGWGDAKVVGAFAVAVTTVPAFVWRSLRHVAPAVEMTMFRVRSLAVANAGTLLISIGLYGMLLCHILFLTGVWGYSALEAGLAISPAPIMAAAVAGPAGRIADRRGQRAVAVPGTVLFALGNVWFATKVGSTPEFAGDWLPGALLSGAGTGLAYPSLASAAVAELPADRFATGSAINATFRQIGGAIGISIVAAILQSGSPAGGLDAFRLGWGLAAAASLAALAAAVGIGRVRARIVEAPILAHPADAADALGQRARDGSGARAAPPV